MADESNPLLQAINEQLSLVQTSILGSNATPDERYAYELFEQELLEWSETAKGDTGGGLGEDLEESSLTIKTEEHHQVEDTERSESGKRIAENHINDRPVKRNAAAVRVRQQLCCTCLEPFLKSSLRTIRECKCQYCEECFLFMINSALETQEIARCCDRNIKMPKALRTIHPDIFQRYCKLYKELDASNPMYCTNPTCHTFLGNFQRLKRKVTCKSCGTESCASCRMIMSEHKGIHNICPEDLNDEMMKQVVETYSLNRCPKCYVVVEKTFGCNNMRCKCGVMFCYKCGEQKTSEAEFCACTRAAREMMPLARDASEDPLEGA